MKAEIDFYQRTDIFSAYSNKVRTETIEDTDCIGLFEQFYKLNNQLKYCNGSYYEFQDLDIKAKYKEWLSSDDYKKKSFGLFYSGSFVD